MLPAYGLVFKSGDDITVAEDQVIDDDLIAFGQKILIKGDVNGDFYAFGQSVTVLGDIQGTIFCGAGNIDIKAKSVKSIWAGGGNISINGRVSRNVVLAGGQLYIDGDAGIGRDLKAFGGNLEIDGDVAGSIKAGVGKFTMNGSGGDVRVDADKIVIESGTEISGDLIVRGKNKPDIEDGAVISGEIKFEEPVEKEKEQPSLSTVAPMIGFLTLFLKVVFFIAKILVGILLIATAKNFVRRVMDTLINEPWKSLGFGALGLFVIPIVVVILIALLIGLPLALFGIYLYTIFFYVSSIFIALVIGEKLIALFKKEGDISLYLSFLVGMVVLFIITLIPVLGFIVKFFVVLFGGGMFLLGTLNLCREIKEKELI